MALFQIFKGNENTLSNVGLHEGYAYFCVDSGKMFIDIASTGDVAENRIPVNGFAADGLLLEDGTFIPADQFAQIEDVIDVEHGGTGADTLTGLLIGNGTNAVTGISIPNNALVLGDSASGAKSVGITNAQVVVGDTTNGVKGVGLTDKAIVVGDSTNGISSVTIPDNAIVLGDATTGLTSVGINGPGVLYALANEIPSWGTLPVAVGGTGATTHALNAILTGNGTSALNHVATASGAFYATVANGAPQFGTLPVAQGGTGGTTAAAARSSLNVYSTDVVYTKTEVDSQVETATSIPYTATLSAANWVQSGESYTYSYTNSALRCGPNGNVPPIVTYTSNQEEYNYIDNAEATKNTGIVFTASERPESNIGIIVIDLA